VRTPLQQDKEMSPMAELLISIGALAIILIGIAIILQIISVEEVCALVGRAVMVFVLMLVALCILGGLWLGVMIPWLSAAFEALKTLIEWLLVIIIGLVVLLFVARLALSRFVGHLTLRRDPQIGEDYDINDCKDTKD
jgi:uncharacterized membrane protein (UPF0182 family)